MPDAPGRHGGSAADQVAARSGAGPGGDAGTRLVPLPARGRLICRRNLIAGGRDLRRRKRRLKSRVPAVRDK